MLSMQYLLHKLQTLVQGQKCQVIKFKSCSPSYSIMLSRTVSKTVSPSLALTWNSFCARLTKVMLTLVPPKNCVLDDVNTTIRRRFEFNILEVILKIIFSYKCLVHYLSNSVGQSKSRIRRSRKNPGHHFRLVIWNNHRIGKIENRSTLLTETPQFKFTNRWIIMVLWVFSSLF